MMFFGVIYYMVPRLTGAPWASGGLVAGHRFLAMGGVLLLVIALAVAGWRQGGALLDPAKPMSEIALSLRGPLLGATVAQAVLILGNLLLLVNFCRSACACAGARTAPAENPFRKPSAMEAHA
jgi:cytochrome c oxidase cbb3-type subunit 1